MRALLCICMTLQLADGQAALFITLGDRPKDRVTNPGEHILHALMELLSAAGRAHDHVGRAHPLRALRSMYGMNGRRLAHPPHTPHHNTMAVPMNTGSKAVAMCAWPRGPLATQVAGRRTARCRSRI